MHPVMLPITEIQFFSLRVGTGGPHDAAGIDHGHLHDDVAKNIVSSHEFPIINTVHILFNISTQIK